jgi:hypothetical protein
MNKSIIIAVGGTGQLILHYYAQLFQVGAIPDPFESVVIDSDALMPSLRKFQSFWKSVRICHPNDVVPMLEHIPIAQGFQGSVENALVGRSLPSAPNIHPVEAFFDSQSLKQQVNEGLFARPALSAVMKTDWNQIPLPSFKGVQRVIVVGSLIGGTGGGLIAPLLSQLAVRLRSVSGERPHLRAVLYGEYFRTDGENQLVPDARERYPSNKLFVAKTLKELAPPELAHFIFIEPDNPVLRDTSKERDPINIQLPDQGHPLWQGVCAVEEVRTNTTWPNTESFEGKEQNLPAERNRNSDMTKVKDRLGVANALQRRSVLTRLLGEVWFERYYGRGLPLLVSRAFACAQRNPALGITSIAKFSVSLQSEYSRAWDDLKSVFPVSDSQASLPSVRNTSWVNIRTDVPELTQSEEGLLRSVSANLLYSALRGAQSI